MTAKTENLTLTAATVGEVLTVASTDGDVDWIDVTTDGSADVTVTVDGTTPVAMPGNGGAGVNGYHIPSNNSVPITRSFDLRGVVRRGVSVQAISASTPKVWATAEIKS